MMTGPERLSDSDTSGRYISDGYYLKAAENSTSGDSRERLPITNIL